MTTWSLGMVSALSPVQEQINCYFPPGTHPYRKLEATIAARLNDTTTILDIGCGRTAPMLRQFKGGSRTLYGVDLVDFRHQENGLRLLNQSVSDMPGIPSACIDVAYSRSVMEHVADVDGAFAEIARVLKPGGVYIFLTPNRNDYASLIASVVPNRLHPRLVHLTTGRPMEDVFDTYYRANTRRDILRLSRSVGLEVANLEYLVQYPVYLKFNRVLFWIGCQYERLLASSDRWEGLRGWILCTLYRTVASAGASQSSPADAMEMSG